MLVRLRAGRGAWSNEEEEEEESSEADFAEGDEGMEDETFFLVGRVMKLAQM